VHKCEHCEDVNYFVAYWKDRIEHESEGRGRCKVREAESQERGRKARGKKSKKLKICLSPKSHAYVITTTSLA